MSVDMVELVITQVMRQLGRVPRPQAWRLARILAIAVIRFNRRHRTILQHNLSVAFGEALTADQMQVLTERVFQHLFMVLFEIGWSLRLPVDELVRHFTIHGARHYAAAKNRGRGVLVLTAHFGNWELLPVVARIQNIPVHIVYRPLDAAPLDRFFKRLRERFGAATISSAKAMRPIMRCLRRGNVAAMLMDQNVDWYEGVYVDFFGKCACTNKGMALLALKTGAPVVPLFLVRSEDGFSAHWLPELPLIRTGDRTKDIDANTQQYNDAIESFARRYPEQWFWVHQRWKGQNSCPWPPPPPIDNGSP